MTPENTTELIALVTAMSRAKGAARSLEGLPPCLRLRSPSAFAHLESAKANLAALEEILGADLRLAISEAEGDEGGYSAN